MATPPQAAFLHGAGELSLEILPWHSLLSMGFAELWVLAVIFPFPRSFQCCYHCSSWPGTAILPCHHSGGEGRQRCFPAGN